MRDINYYLTVICSFVLVHSHFITDFLQFVVLLLTAIFSFYNALIKIKEYQKQNKKTQNE